MLLEWMSRQMRRAMTGYPSAATGELHNAWLSEQVRSYATPQPYAGPLTSSADNWTGETWEMREGYRKYAFKEPSVKSSLMTKILAVSELDMVVTPDDKRDKMSREVAQYVKWSIGKSTGGSPKLVQDVGLHALVDGFSVTEKVLDQVDSDAPRYQQFFTLKEGKTKDTRGIRFRMDTFKNVVGVRSMIAAQGGMEFDPKDFIIFTHLKLFQNPFGISDLRAANRAANLIEAAIKLRSILLENFSGPYLVGKASDPGARAQIMAVLAQARARGWIVVPEDSSVEVINLATSAPDQFQNTIEDLRQEVVTAIQGAYLQLLEGGVTNGRGDTQVHKSVAQLLQWWLAVTISASINDSLVADLVYPNYGRSVGLPTVQLGGIDAATISAELDKFKKGQELGVKLSAKQVCEVGGFETPEDANDVLTPPNQQQPPGGPGGGLPGGGNPPPDLSDVFGGGDTDPDPVQVEQDADAAQFAHQEFSEEQYAAMAERDRSHLVKAQRRDKNGIMRTVYVNPNTGDHGTEEERMRPRADAEGAVNKMLSEPHNMTPADLADLPNHLQTLTVARKREILRQLTQKVGGVKAALAQRILDVARGRAPTPAATSPPVAPPVAPPPTPAPPPPPPVPPPTPAQPARGANGFPPNMDLATVSQRTRDQIAEVVAGRLDPANVRNQLASRLNDGGRTITDNVARQYGLSDAAYNRLSDVDAARHVAAAVLSVAAGREIPLGPRPTTAPAARPASPPPPTPAAPRAPVLAQHEFTTPADPNKPKLPTDPPRIPQGVTFDVGEAEAKRTLSTFFGKDVDPKMFAAAVNAHDGARVTIDTASDGAVLITTTGDGYYASRRLSKDADGTVYMKNSYFRMQFEPSGQPPPDHWKQTNQNVTGSQLLANQIRAARALGVTKLKTHAARGDDTDNPNDSMNGYYTWPRGGYDDSIPARSLGKLQRERPDLAALLTQNPTGSTKPNSILNLMTTEDGRKWWQKNGDDLFTMEFDLKKDSLSMRTAAAYAAERAAAGGRRTTPRS